MFLIISSTKNFHPKEMSCTAIWKVEIGSQNSGFAKVSFYISGLDILQNIPHEDLCTFA